VLTCINNTLGDGKEDDIVEGPCEKGKEGIITYQCKSSEWRETDRNCILQVIIEIEKKVEVIFNINVLVKNKSTVHLKYF